MPKKILIIGGPGTGKSTIINNLQQKGYCCMLEISRELTLEAQKLGTEQLFLSNPLLFSEKLLEGRINQYKKASISPSKYVFFDRGIPDVKAYLDYIKQDYSEVYQTSCEQYRYDNVFILPPWEAIYTQDNERYENFEQALEIQKYIEKNYMALGYNLIEVPKDSVNKRVSFILSHL